MRSKIVATITLVLPLSVPLACSGDTSPDDAFRVLPVAAVMIDGDEVLVGTYDTRSHGFDLVPAFVEQLDVQSGGAALQLVGGDHEQPLAVHAVWAEDLNQGSRLTIATADRGPSMVGAYLVLHDEAWTDGLTEAEAASSYSACWDIPEHCNEVCLEIPEDQCREQYPECFVCDEICMGISDHECFEQFPQCFPEGPPNPDEGGK